ncbi:MAG: SAM-dependent methyltransferase, partial [Magnetococcales bacterium]|nr:SAM-dependent methyltransferase [Magnetococcales bacterium]
HRVLKPGGKFYLFELLAPFIQHPLWRTLLEHPQEDRFNDSQLANQLREQGFTLLGHRSLLGQVAWYVGRKD